MLDDFRALAERYGYALPAPYAEALASIPAVMQEYGLTPDERAEVERMSFLTDPALAEDENEEARAEDPDADPEGEPWPDELFVIGGDGLGDCLCIDLSGARPGVGSWKHEVGEFVFYDPAEEDEMGYTFASPLDYLHAVCARLVEWRSL